MSNPLAIFRRYQYILLVVFGVMLMIAFVIAPPLDDYLRMRSLGEAMADDVVVTWRGGSFRESELARLRQKHLLAFQYLLALVQDTIQREGTPRGVQRDQLGRIVAPGIPPANSDQELVETYLLARKGETMGMVISDEAVIEFLENLTDERLLQYELGQIFAKNFGDRFDERTLIDQLKTELLAMRVREMAQSGLLVPPPGAVTPSQAWEYFQRLNRRVKLEVAPLAVADYEAQVKGEPTEGELTALYNEGKDRFAQPDRSEPGFRRRRELAFQFVKADFDKFLQEEKAKVIGSISDADIEAHYEQNKQRYTVNTAPTPPAAPTEAPAAPPAPAAPASTPAPTEPAPAPSPTPAAPAPAAPAPAAPAPTEPTPAAPAPSPTPAPAAPAPAAPAPTPAPTEPAPAAPAPSPAPAAPAPAAPAPTEPAPAPSPTPAPAAPAPSPTPAAPAPAAPAPTEPTPAPSPTPAPAAPAPSPTPAAPAPAAPAPTEPAPAPSPTPAPAGPAPAAPAPTPAPTEPATSPAPAAPAPAAPAPTEPTPATPAPSPTPAPAGPVPAAPAPTPAPTEPAPAAPAPSPAPAAPAPTEPAPAPDAPNPTPAPAESAPASATAEPAVPSPAEGAARPSTPLNQQDESDCLPQPTEGATALVVLQDPAAAEPSQPAPTTPAAEPTSPSPTEAAEKPAGEKPAAEKPADSPTPAAPAPAAETPAAPATSPTPPTETQPTTSPSEPAAPTAAAPQGTPAAAETPPATPPATSITPPVPAIRPLDETLRGEIRDELAEVQARKAAQDRIRIALAEVQKAVNKFAFEARRKASATEGLDADLKSAGLVPGIDELATKQGLMAGSIPLVNTLQVREYELGQASSFEFTSWPPQQTFFYDSAYNDDRRLYDPTTIRSMSGVEFLYWKTDEQAAFTPKFAEVRDDLVAAWKRIEARKLARQQAEKFREQAVKAGGSLTAALAGSNLAVTELSEFSWMSTGGMPGGMSPPMVSDVPGVEFAGEEFMKAVFALKPNGYGVATNQPQTVVYVVHLLSQSPAEESLRDQFLATGVPPEVAYIAYMENVTRVRDWYEGVEKEYGVVWSRPTTDQGG